jgi:cell division protein FtsL
MNFIIRFILIIIGLGAVAMISLALTQETYRRYQIQKEIEELKAQADKKEKDNQQLKGLINYIKTDDFQEKEAKEKLGVQKEGEKVLGIRGDRTIEKKSEDASLEKSSSVKDNRSNLKKWWDYFFAT